MVPHRLEEGKSVSEDVEPQKGVDCDVPHWLGRSPSRRVLKPLVGNRKEKPKEDNIC